MVFKHYLLWLFLSITVVACGGGGGNSENNSDTTINPFLSKDLTSIPTQSGQRQQGDIVAVKYLQEHTQTSINTTLVAQPDKLPALDVLYDVKSYQLNYMTLDGHNQLVEASALIVIPQKTSPTPSPILSFQHGTKFYNREAPTQVATADAPEVITAAIGYIVASADYVGYGASQSLEHPYLLERPSAYAVIDMLHALRTWLDFHQYPHNQQLFLTGYSEGGYVTMAAHKIMQEQQSAPFNIIASVVGAGPYHLDLSLKELFRGIGRLPALIADPVIGLLVSSLAPEDSDIAFQTTFLERYFNGETQDNVHEWRANVPIRLYHGKDDQTVPYESSLSTLNALQAQQSVDIELIDCPAAEANHSNCVLPYWLFMSNYFAGMADGL